MTCGDKIKQIRTEKGLKQAELARKTGLSPQTLFKYEKNIVTNIPLNSIISIAQVLKVEPSVLINQDEKFSKSSNDNPIESLLTNLTDEETAKVIGFIQGLLDNR